MINLYRRVRHIAVLVALIVYNCRAACPTSFMPISGRCYKYNLGMSNRSGALTACASIGGWLATLDTQAIAADVQLELNIVTSTYIGLYKTNPCVGSGCDGKYSWESGPGQAPSTTGYTANMAQQKPSVDSWLYFIMDSNMGFLWSDVDGTANYTYLCEAAFLHPSMAPTFVPTSKLPTHAPTRAPTFTSMRTPTLFPTGTPTPLPTPSPSKKPTVSPTARPSAFTLEMTELGQIVPADATPDILFGKVVSLYGDTLVVGAVEKAYVYRTSDTGQSWDRVTTLFPTGGGLEQQDFGYSISLYDTICTVSARSRGGKGAVYVYVSDADRLQWNQTQIIEVVDGAEGDMFGYSISLYGANLVVGAPFHDAADVSNSGAVYVFSSTDHGVTWPLVKKLVAPIVVESQSFGYAVSLHDKTLAIGSRNNTAYAFGLFLQWSLQATLRGSDAEEDERFGSSVAAGSNLIFVGAPYSDSAAGAVYIFRFTFPSSWPEGQVLQASDPRSGSFFGYALSLYGDQLVVGTFAVEPTFSAAYLFWVETESFWQQRYRVEPVVSAPDDKYGSAVALYKDYLIVGARGNDAAASDAGKVYTYDFYIPPTGVPTGSPSAWPTTMPSGTPKSQPTSDPTLPVAFAERIFSLESVKCVRSLSDTRATLTTPYKVLELDISIGTVTLCGQDESGYVDGPGSSALFGYITSIAVARASGVIYICDRANNVIRSFDQQADTVSTLAGTGSTLLYDGIGSGAAFHSPEGIDITPSEDFLLVADRQSNLIRKVSLPIGVVQTIGGDGTLGSVDGVGTAAQFFKPLSIRISPDSSYAVICQSLPVHSIRKMDMHSYAVSTILEGNIYNPIDISFNLYGSGFYVAEGGGKRIRYVDNSNNMALTFHSGAAAFLSVDVLPSGLLLFISSNNVYSVTTPTVFPTQQPSNDPSYVPTAIPTSPSNLPTSDPSNIPSVRPSTLPTMLPTACPTARPSGFPTSFPSSIPTEEPTGFPSSAPSVRPTISPSGDPSGAPTGVPSASPSVGPTVSPSGVPTGWPSTSPSAIPSRLPSQTPSGVPSGKPSSWPTRTPSGNPTTLPSNIPTSEPSRRPSDTPSGMPSMNPTLSPSSKPTVNPSILPTGQPSSSPSVASTRLPSSEPTGTPSVAPTCLPSCAPSNNPSGKPTDAPTSDPSCRPTMQPTATPSAAPTLEPTGIPSGDPSAIPSGRPTRIPSTGPSYVPSGQPSGYPSALPSASPTGDPSAQPSNCPSSRPSQIPTGLPSGQPSNKPSRCPTTEPSTQPSGTPTALPTYIPSVLPTAEPSVRPSRFPSRVPSAQPSSLPSNEPSCNPSGEPSGAPSASPSCQPTVQPTVTPTGFPTLEPTGLPSGGPSAIPSGRPTRIPSTGPSYVPSGQPSGYPSALPSASPTGDPSAQPSNCPSSRPSQIPTGLPSGQPSNKPSRCPTTEPSTQPSGTPTALPTYIPSVLPTAEPSVRPSHFPSRVPSAEPSSLPSNEPSCNPSGEPSGAPSASPSCQPTVQPTVTPTGFPTLEPTGLPSGGPSGQPTVQPTTCPTGVPSAGPSAAPSCQPIGFPTSIPSVMPSGLPSALPSTQPSTRPSGYPTSMPSMQPIASPSEQPSSFPTTLPTGCPSASPSAGPTGGPTQISAVPFILSKSVSTSRSEVNISMLLDSEGSVACGYYSSGDQPSSLYSILVQNFVSQSTKRVAMVSVTGLSAGTNYSLYCTTWSSGGYSLSYDDTIKTRTFVSTDCCKVLSVSLRSAYILDGGAQYLDVALSAPPQFSVDVVVSSFSGNDSIVGSDMFHPSSVHVSSTGPLVHQFMLVKYEKGSYTVGVSLLGVSAKEYDIIYSSNMKFSVVETETSVPAPTVVDAYFSSSGETITIRFSGATNQGGFYGKFSCGMLLSFTAATATACQWKDSSNLLAFPSPASGLVPKGGVYLLGGKVCSSCLAQQGSCSSYPSSEEQRIVLRGPDVPAIPKVYISSSAVIGVCDEMVVDFSASTGFGGRAWKSIEVRVDGGGSNITLVRRHVAKHTLTASRIVVPSKYLDVRGIYKWHVKCCNFLSSCGEATAVVEVSSAAVPVVNILGPTLRTVYRNSSFQLIAVSHTTDCSGDKSSNGLQYSWTVYEQSGSTAVVSTLNSVSLDPRIFLVKQGRVRVGASYTFHVQVVNVRSGLSATQSASVLIARGAMGAVISGGLQQSFRSGETIQLDGRESFDEALSQSGEALQYEWSCVRLKPTFDASNCGILFVGSVYSPTVGVAAINSSENVLAQVILSITGYRGKTASSKVLLKVVKQQSSMVKITTTSSTLNPGDKLKLSAVVSSTEGGTATWTVDNPSVGLSAFARSSLTRSFSKSELLFPTVLHLILDPNALYGRDTFTFTLSFLTSGNDSAVSTASVITNGEPFGGALQADPISGLALSTQFTLSAVMWEDEDLPLYYIFEYDNFAEADSFVTIRSKADISSCTSLLPRGSPQAMSHLSVVVRVLDLYGAATNVSTNVTVLEQPDALVQVAQLASAGVGSPSSNLDERKGTIAVLGSVLNSALCFAAPDCDAINRLPCAIVQNTCGRCKNGYIGDDGPSNSPCISPVDRLQETGSCEHKLDCGKWQDCLNGNCVNMNKSCPNNCSDNGICEFRSVVHSTYVPLSCAVGDVTCVAVCRCNDIGSGVSCATSVSDMLIKRTAREDLLRQFSLILSGENPDALTVKSWVSLLVSLSGVVDELSLTAKHLCIKASRKVLEVSLKNSIPFSYVESILKVITALKWTDSDVGDQSVYATSEVEIASGSVLAISELLELYAELISRQLVSGEVPQVAITNLFSVVTSMNQFSVGTEVEISSPISSLEDLLGIQPQSLAFASGQWQLQEGVLASITVVATSSMLYNEPLLNSRVVRLQYPESLSGYCRSCPVMISLQHSIPIYPAENSVFISANESISSFLTKHAMHCEKGQIYNRTISCPGGVDHVLECNGSWAGSFNVSCPLRYGSPACNSLDGSSIVRNNCTVVSFTPHNTTCECYLGDEASVKLRRRLVNDLSNSTTASVDFVAMIEYTLTEFESTWTSADSLSVASVSNSWKVLVTIGVVCCFAVGSALSGEYIDQQQEKIYSDDKKAEQPVSELSVGDIIDDSLPNILREKPFSEKFKREIKIYHRWFGVIFTYSKQVSRAVRILSLVTSMIILMFANAVTYNLGYPDDGSCESYDQPSACEQDESSFSGDSKCYWSFESSDCHFREPASDMRMVIFTAIIAAVMSTPCAVFADYVIMNYIAAETKTLHDPSVQRFNSSGSRKRGVSNASTARQRRTNNLVAVVPEDQQYDRHSNRLGIIDRKSSNGHQKDDLLPTTLQEDMSMLMADIRQFRQNLNSSDLQNFDDMWALDADGTFVSNQSSLLGSVRAMIGRPVANVYQIVSLDLWKVRNRLAKEIVQMETAKGDFKIGQRLLYLFQKDLLPGVNAMILESKGQRDFVSESNKVEPYKKYMAWAFVISLNSSLVFYIYLFSIRQTEERQQAWFQTFIVWLVLEIFAMSTMVVLLMHVIIPMLTMRDLSKVKSKLKLTILDYLKDVKSSSHTTTSKKEDRRVPQSEFNVAEYFFVSTRLSALTPDLKESQMIQKFSTPWPHQSYRRSKSLSSGYRKRFATLGQSISMIMVFFLKGLLSMPSVVQDMFVNLFSVVIFGNFLSFAVDLYHIDPALGILPFLLLLLFLASMAYLFVRYVRSTSSGSGKVGTILPTPEIGCTAELPKGENFDTGISTRRQSMAQGVLVAREVHELHQRGEEQTGRDTPKAVYETPLPLYQLYEISDDSDSDESVPDVLPSVNIVASVVNVRHNTPIPELYCISDDEDEAPNDVAVRPAEKSAAKLLEEMYQISDDDEDDSDEL